MSYIEDTIAGWVIGATLLIIGLAIYAPFAKKDAPLNEQISLSAVLLKVSGGGEHCFERGAKTYCVRRIK